MNAYSLHIGINRFDRRAYGGQNIDLKACVADANDMDAIAAALGYGDRTVLLDEEATRGRILAEISRLAGAAVAGDTVLITLSSHGALVPDADHDDDTYPLGKDTALLAHDGMVPDDTVWRYLAKFKPGVRIAMLFDTCHSQDAARFACLEEGWPRLSIRAARGESVRAASQDAEFKAMRALGRPDDIDAQALLVSACKKDEFSLDGRSNGAFTEVVKAVYRRANDWHEFCTMADAASPKSQTPVLSCYNADDHFLASRPLAPVMDGDPSPVHRYRN